MEKTVTRQRKHMDAPMPPEKEGGGEGVGTEQTLFLLPQVCTYMETKKKITQTLSGIQHFNHFHSTGGQRRETWSSSEWERGGQWA